MSQLTRKQLAKAFLSLAKYKSRLEAVQALAAYLVVNKLSRELPLLLNDIAIEYQSHGHIYANVTSAHELSESLEEQIKTALRELAGASTAEINKLIDNNLISGAVIETPEYRIDLSAKSKLDKLRAK